MYRIENRLRIFSNRVVSALLSLPLSVSLARIPCKPKLSIEPAFLSFYSVSILASARYFLQMGVVPWTKSSPSSYNEQVDNAGWLDRLLSQLMKHDLKLDRWRDLTSSSYNHEGDVQRAGLLQEWLSSVKCRSEGVFSPHRIRSCRFLIRRFQSEEIWSMFENLNRLGVFKGLRSRILWKIDDGQYRVEELSLWYWDHQCAEQGTTPLMKHKKLICS